MNLLIPFNADVEFTTDVKEICSISLEHEYTKNEKEILGNFIISGTYKEHELSINQEDFNFLVPFSVDLPDNVLLDTIDLNIDNFTYEINDKTMSVNIDYIIEADIETPEVNTIEEDIIMEENTNNNLRDDLNIIDVPIKENDLVTDVKEIKEENIITPANIISNVNMSDDYLNIIVHIVKETDTLDLIATNYKVSKDELLDFNNISEININDKLLIPCANE